MEYIDLATVGIYDDLPNAHIALGRLETEGISASLKDAHFVQTDWLYSIALGGIKLQVPVAQATRAREILATDYSEDVDAQQDQENPD